MSERLPAIHLRWQSPFYGPQEHLTGAGVTFWPHLDQQPALQATQGHIVVAGELQEAGTVTSMTGIKPETTGLRHATTDDVIASPGPQFLLTQKCPQTHRPQAECIGVKKLQYSVNI